MIVVRQAAKAMHDTSPASVLPSQLELCLTEMADEWGQQAIRP
jgi:hypothetical protein